MWISVSEWYYMCHPTDDLGIHLYTSYQPTLWTCYRFSIFFPQEIRHLCSYLQELKKASAEEMRRSVYANYAAFIRLVSNLLNLFNNFSIAILIVLIQLGICNTHKNTCTQYTCMHAIMHVYSKSHLILGQWLSYELLTSATWQIFYHTAMV